MDKDSIAEIGVDEQGRLYVAPQTKAFPYIDREAMEIHWDDTNHYLFAPPPPRAELAQSIWWFQQIIAAAKEQTCELRLAPDTKWHGISQQLRAEIISALGAAHA